MRNHMERHTASGAAKLRLIRRLLQRLLKLLRRFFPHGVLDQNLQFAQAAFELNRLNRF
jgi:hypothetical protein